MAALSPSPVPPIPLPLVLLSLLILTGGCRRCSRRVACPGQRTLWATSWGAARREASSLVASPVGPASHQ